MSARVDIKGNIYSSISVLEYSETVNTHAIWKCLCMECNSLLYVTYSNLVRNDTKKCTSCANSKISMVEKFEIKKRIEDGEMATHIAKDLNINVGIVQRVKKKFICSS